MTGSKSRVIIGTMRPPFLVLPPVCVLLGISTAYYAGAVINLYHVILILLGAISAHISVNALNEYSDFKSGLDLKTKPTPFSGGSGTLPKHPDKAGLSLVSGIITFFITIIIGFYFLWLRGIWILPIGGLGLIVIAAYTPFITKKPILCLVSPGLGFGVFMVMGTHFVLAGSYSWASFVVSLVPFFLVNNLLLLNQFPDVEADQSIGRKHFPIVIGRKSSVWVYTAFLVLAYITVFIGFLFGILPLMSFLAYLSILIAVPTVIGAFKYAENISGLIPSLGKNVILNIITPVLLAIGIFVG